MSQRLVFSYLFKGDFPRQNETVQDERVSSAELKALARHLKDQIPQTSAAILALPDEVPLADAVRYAKLISSMLSTELASY